jgi:hypothetical protein
MKRLISTIIVAGLLTIPALASAEKDMTYPVNLNVNESKSVKVELPVGKSVIDVFSYDDGAVYIAKLHDANGDVVATCDQVKEDHSVFCRNNTNAVALPLKIVVDVENHSTKLITVNVHVYPAK